MEEMPDQPPPKLHAGFNPDRPAKSRQGRRLQRIREEIERNRQSVRGRNSVSEQARLAPSRLEEIVAGEQPTREEHQKICRALPRMKFYLPVLEGWLKQPPPPMPPPSSRPADAPVNGTHVEGVSKPTVPELPPTPPSPLLLVPRSFGEFLRAAREREALSPYDLAELLELSPAAIYGWERDESTPVADNYGRLLEVLPALAAPGVPRPEVRDIPKPVGRGGIQEPPPAATLTPALSQRSPLVAFGVQLGRAGAALKGSRAIVVGLLRDGAAAGLTCEEIAQAIEEAS